MKKLLVVLSCLSVTAVSAMTLKTTSFDMKKSLPNKHVFQGFGCNGENVSPELEWSGAPPGTKSFAVTAYDPDAPTGSGWWHWTVVNIPADVMKLEEGASSGKLPAGAMEGRTDFGKPGYGGACPPPGKPHRYIFTVFALGKDKLDGVTSEASGAMVGFNLNPPTVLDKASFTVKYGR